VIINAGVPGNNTAQLLARLDGDVLSHHPELVIMMVGTNDMLWPQNSLPLEEYRKNLGLLADRIVKAGCHLLLLTPLPCISTYVLQRNPGLFFAAKDPDTKVLEAGQVMQDVAATRAIPVIDLHALFSGEEGSLEAAKSLIRNVANSQAPNDGVHPTAAGYEYLAQIVADAIVRHNLPHTRIVCFGDSVTYGSHMTGEGTVEGDTYPAKLKKLVESGAL